MNEFFIYNQRLGIKLPHLQEDWSKYDSSTQNSILSEWENIRGGIPDRIRELEKQINIKQDALSVEQDFALSCLLNEEIAELASIINDLWIWYRTNQETTDKMHN